LVLLRLGARTEVLHQAVSPGGQRITALARGGSLLFAGDEGGRIYCCEAARPPARLSEWTRLDPQPITSIRVRRVGGEPTLVVANGTKCVLLVAMVEGEGEERSLRILPTAAPCLVADAHDQTVFALTGEQYGTHLEVLPATRPGFTAERLDLVERTRHRGKDLIVV